MQQRRKIRHKATANNMEYCIFLWHVMLFIGFQFIGFIGFTMDFNLSVVW